MKYMFAGAFAALSLLLVISHNDAGEKAKHTIPEVMKRAMKGGLCKTVASGKGTDAEKKELVALFTSLTQNKPPQGELDAWKKKTGAMLDAAKKIADGDPKAGKTLQGLVNCKTCHAEFRE
jgi:hypothetical protein